MIALIWILVILAIVYLVYEFRYYIMYFFSLLNVTHKNQKGIKDIQKKGMDNRNLSNEELKKYVKLARKYLEENNLFPKQKKYILNEELERHLRYSRFSKKYVRELLDDILDYLNLDKEKVILKVNYISSKYSISYGGLYADKITGDSEKKKILINIKNSMTMETVISILAHESTHYLLISNGILLDNTIENECLTDVTALVIGFGKYMEEGYKISNRVIYDEIDHRSIDKERVGYLSYKDIKVANKYIKKHH